MKKVLLIAAALIISCSLMSCSKSDDKKTNRNDITPFEGTWQNADLTDEVTFRGKTLTASSAGVPLAKGTFTYNDEEIALLYTHIWDFDTSSWTNNDTEGATICDYSFEADGSLDLEGERYTRVQS